MISGLREFGRFWKWGQIPPPRWIIHHSLIWRCHHTWKKKRNKDGRRFRRKGSEFEDDCEWTKSGIFPWRKRFRERSSVVAACSRETPWRQRERWRISKSGNDRLLLRRFFFLRFLFPDGVDGFRECWRKRYFTRSDRIGSGELRAMIGGDNLECVCACTMTGASGGMREPVQHWIFFCSSRCWWSSW